MSKALIKRTLRRLGIIKLSDNFRYQLIKIRNKKDNTKFKKEKPNIAIPPDYILYESHYLNYRGYFTDGLTNAKNLKKHFEKHIDLTNKKVLDWGCGPARIVRHFPDLLPNTMFYGTQITIKKRLRGTPVILKMLFFVQTKQIRLQNLKMNFLMLFTAYQS